MVSNGNEEWKWDVGSDAKTTLEQIQTAQHAKYIHMYIHNRSGLPLIIHANNKLQMPHKQNPKKIKNNYLQSKEALQRNRTPIHIHCRRAQHIAPNSDSKARKAKYQLESDNYLATLQNRANNMK